MTGRAYSKPGRLRNAGRDSEFKENLRAKIACHCPFCQEDTALQVDFDITRRR